MTRSNRSSESAHLEDRASWKNYRGERLPRPTMVKVAVTPKRHESLLEGMKPSKIH